MQVATAWLHSDAMVGDEAACIKHGCVVAGLHYSVKQWQVPHAWNTCHCARYMTFWRQFKSKWCKILKFLPPSDHSACDDCVSYKELFAEATDARTKVIKTMIERRVSHWMS